MEKAQQASEATRQQQSGATNPPCAAGQEYEQVNENFRMLADIRFKLLALIPPLGGVAIFLLSQAAISKQEGAPVQTNPSDYALVFLLAWMGFLATLGLTFYDQRNTELYNALISRARLLERQLKLYGGQFQARPPRSRRLFFFILMGHDTGLALIYGTVLGAWFFPIVYSGLRWFDVKGFDPFRNGLLAAFIMTLVFIEELLRFDGAWSGLWARIYKLLWPETSVARREIALLENLKAIREAITRYKAYQGEWPANLENLVARGYLPALPPNPMPDQAWRGVTEREAQLSEAGTGIVNVRSEGDLIMPERRRFYTNNRGKRYSDW
jgi:hypothetical protein